MKIRIGTRKSQLALWQANFVAGALKERGIEVEIVKITTQEIRYLMFHLQKSEEKVFL